MTSVVERGQNWLTFLDARLSAAVQAVSSGEDDPLRGLYISDAQALELSRELGTLDTEPRLADAVRRLRLDPLDAEVLVVCAAPELHPRYGRLYGYLQDDVTRRFPSPRLVARLLRGSAVRGRDVLQRFAAGERLSQTGALRLLESDGPIPLADRSIKLADRLAAFLLGVTGEQVPVGSRPAVRRVEVPAQVFGRSDAVEEIARSLGAATHIPLVVCGPDRHAMLAAAARRACCGA